MDKSKKSKDLEFKLREIIRDENKKLSLQELEQFIYELKNDCRELSNNTFNDLGELENTLSTKGQITSLRENIMYYDGEANAFQIVLDLLQHLDDIRKTDND
jgi:hypothetical protein